MCWRTGSSMVGGRGNSQGVVRPIRLGPYNIWNGRNEGMESTLCRTSQANMYLSAFQETKLSIMDKGWWRQRCR